jgi:hypothetical protein
MTTRPASMPENPNRGPFNQPRTNPRPRPIGGLQVLTARQEPPVAAGAALRSAIAMRRMATVMLPSCWHHVPEVGWVA